jgi:nucleoside-diphosphate-sugar epimerase
MRILILGGTGAMGTHLVEITTAAGMEVHVTSRTQIESTRSVHYICGNAQDDAFIQQILARKWDAIVDFMVYSTASFTKRFEQILDATQQYFYLSSARVYADSRKPITENSPRLLEVSQDKEFLATDEYALAKARQENILMQSGRKNWTIVRPYITYACERLQLGVLEKEGWLYRVLQGRSLVFSGDIKERLTTMTSGIDVAKAIASLIGKTEALSEVFHVTASRPYEWNQILSIYLDVLEEHLRKRPRERSVKIAEFLSFHKAKYQVTHDRLFNRVFDNRKIAQFVDVEKFVDAKDGLRISLKAFLRRPSFKEIDWQSEAIKDWLAQEQTSLREIRGIRNVARYLLHRYARSPAYNNKTSPNTTIF